MPTITYTQFDGSQLAKHRRSQPDADLYVLYAYSKTLKQYEELLQTYLSLEEQARANNFIYDEDRIAAIGAHALIRICCSANSDASPENLTLQYQETGKPFLLSPDTQEHFHVSLSHCRAGVAVVFSRRGDVGIDIEQINPDFEYHDIATSFFHPSEAARCRNQPSGIGAHTFYSHWTKKEAFIKATGEGLSRELKSFLVPEEDFGSVYTPEGIPVTPCWLVEGRQLQHNLLLAIAYKKAPEPDSQR